VTVTSIYLQTVRVLGCALAMLACIGAHACSTDAPLAALTQGCSINSDCASPLVCAFEACHVQCKTSVDCMGDELCVQATPPFKVCEAPVTCTLNSECPPNQVCGFGQTCRNPCETARDCIAGQTCVEHSCVDPTTPTDAGLLGSEASVDAALGIPCIHSSDCPSSLQCLGTGYCGVECLTSKDCSAGTLCVAARCVATTVDAGKPDVTLDAGDHDATHDASANRCGALTSCEDDGAVHCADLATDNASCGACGHVCGAGTSCASGSCAPSCTSPLAVCGSACVDPRSDPDNCGTCGHVCGPYTNATPVCVEGTCAELCQPDRLDCSASQTAGCTITPLTDPSNCGFCGNVCSTGLCSAGACTNASSCLAILADNPTAPSGVYTIDLDGPGPDSPLPMYCDMAGGGWTLIVNQVPRTSLPNLMTTVNAAGFGTLVQSYRLGNPDVTTITPTVAWKLTDSVYDVYFKPTCVVDWTQSYASSTAANACTLGYTSTAFTTIVNGGWFQMAGRGIGINNSGNNCSIRAYNYPYNSTGGLVAGGNPALTGYALPCISANVTMDTVQLWFL